MSANQKQPRFSLSSPAIYVIKIVGYLDDSWSEQLGMTMEHTTINDDTTITVLRGVLVDQAALFGVLDGLYGLGFPLLLVDCELWS